MSIDMNSDMNEDQSEQKKENPLKREHIKVPDIDPKSSRVFEAPKKGKVIKIPAVEPKVIRLGIRGLSPYISHQWDEKNIRMMAEKHAGNKTKTREARDPEAEFRAAIYHTADNRPGFPAMSLKNAIVSFADNKENIAKTHVRKAIFMLCDDPNGVIPIDYEQLVMRTDTVRVSNSAADLRYRPMFIGWRADVSFQINLALMSEADFLNLVNNAGFSIGIGEWRPEKNGEFGRFTLESNVEIA